MFDGINPMLQVVFFIVLVLFYQCFQRPLADFISIGFLPLLQADREREDDSVFIYPYDLGTWNNIKQVRNYEMIFIEYQG